MVSSGSFKAVVHLNNVPEEIVHLKRLILIFDEIYYIYPQIYCLEDIPKEKLVGVTFDLFKDCAVYDVKTLDYLENTLSILSEAGITKGIYANDQQLKDFRREIAIIDEKDPEFRKLIPESRGAVLPFKAKDSIGHQKELTAVSPSIAMWDSLILTNTLFLANTESLFPVFLDPRHRREMEYRYNQYKQQSSKIASEYSNLISPISVSSQFGEITFSIFNNLWSHEFLINKSLQEIIAYRNNMVPARRK